MFRRMWNHLMNRINPVTVGREVVDTMAHRVIPQGAAELSHFLHHGHAGYTPYGAPQSFDAIVPQNASRGDGMTPGQGMSR